MLSIAFAAVLTLFFPTRSMPQLTPTPTLDRLAIPVVPANPTPIDLGRQVYYQNCMPCHGDVGQGLTEEWRNVWAEDHRNCWEKGCHGGRRNDEGFPLPQTIPAVIGPEANSQQFESSLALVAYLQETHPPQRPGKLDPAEYEEVAAFLWHENQRDETAFPLATVIVAGGLALVLAWLVWRLRVRRADR